MLNGRKLVEEGIVTNAPEECIAQHGVDLQLSVVQKIDPNSMGRIPLKGKTTLVEYENIPPIAGMWVLQPGMYSIEFSQGCNIPNNKMLLIRQRSSALRNGTIVHSSVFDAGFKTEKMGTMMIVTHPITIEVGARIAQIYDHVSDEIADEDLYGAEGKGSQFQNDSQRKK